MLSSRRKFCRRYNGMRCEADRRAHIPRVGTLTPSRTHCEADRRAHIPRVSTLTPFGTHCEADRRAHIPCVSTLTPSRTHCEADRCAHIPRVSTLTPFRTHCEADRRAHIPRLSTLTPLCRHACGREMAEREGLCSLTLRIPLPLAAGALATDWQPDGLRPSAVFVSQRLASKLAAGKQIQPAACAAGCPGCGEGGIRTPGAFQLNSFQDCRNRPLYHLSNMSNPRKAVLTKQPTRSISRIGSAKVINLNKCTKKLYGYPQNYPLQVACLPARYPPQ